MGSIVGCDDGAIVGLPVGYPVGVDVGCDDGAIVGIPVGSAVGPAVGIHREFVRHSTLRYEPPLPQSCHFPSLSIASLVSEVPESPSELGGV